MACRVIEMRLPHYLESTEVTEHCLNDLFITSDDETEENFKNDIGISRNEFKILIDAGFFDCGALDDKIGYFAISESTLNIEMM
jgi:hypothetical protein